MLYHYYQDSIRTETAKDYVRHFTGMEHFDGLDHCAQALLAYIDVVNRGTITLKDNRYQIILPENAEQHFVNAVKELDCRSVALATDMFFKLALVNPDIHLEQYIMTQGAPSNYIGYETSPDFRPKISEAIRQNVDPRKIYALFKAEFEREVRTFSRDIPDIAAKIQEIVKLKPVQKTFIMHRPSATDMEDRTYLQHDLAFYPHRHKRLFDWEVLKRTLEALGATVIEHEQDASSRSCFVRDPLIVTPQGCVIVPKPEDELIHSERSSLLNTLKHHGFERVAVTDVDIHGGEVAFHPSKKIMFISDTQGNASTKANALKKERSKHEYDVIPLSIRPEHSTEFYHLDFAMMKLGKKMLCCLDVFTDDSKTALRRHLGTDLIPVSLKDARNMALNGVTVGKAVIMPECTDTLERIIKKEGFLVITPEKLGLKKGDFCFAKGGPHCLTLDIPSRLLSKEGAER